MGELKLIINNIFL